MNSSKIKCFTILFLAIISISGCKKFLELDPPYTQDAENYFENPKDYEMALIGAYDLLQTSFITIWIGEIASDNSIAGGESVNDTEGLHQIDNMTHGAVNTELRNVFRWNYAGIARTNYILENKDNIDFEGKDKIIAETKFLRAYYYFELVKYFGGVPLVLDVRLGVDEVNETERNSEEDVYLQIEKDLSEAITALDWFAEIKGRVDKGAALALLGKVYLYHDKFTESAEIFDQVITEGQYALAPDFSNLFFVSSENNSETVFDVQYSGLEGGSYGCLHCLEGNAAPGFQGIRQYSGPVYGDGNSYNLPTQELYDVFSSSDPRREATILDLDAFIASQVNAEDITYAIGAGGHTGYYNNEYIKRVGEIGLPDNDLTSPVNYRVIRYADVLLMAAEAHNRKASPNDALALDYVNQVRDRVNMNPLSSSGNQLTEDIWKERRLELSCEGLRFFDLVRTGKAKEMIVNFEENKHEVFPIPQVEIDLAGGNWDQNIGY